MSLRNRGYPTKSQMIKRAKKIFIFSRPYELYVQIPKKEAIALSRKKATMGDDPPWMEQDGNLYID